MKLAVAILIVTTLASCEEDSTVVPPVPQAPSSLTASLHSEGIALNWLDNSSNETRFEVESAIETGNYQPLSILTINQTSFTHRNLEPVRYYKYRVRACNDVGCSAWSNESGRRAAYIPFAPSFVSVVATAITQNQATLVADVETGATQTQLWFEYVPAGQSFGNAQRTQAVLLEPRYDSEGFLDESRGSSFIFNLTPGAAYTFRALALNGMGADTSSTITFTTRP